MGETLTVAQVLDADLPDWSPLLQALHSRFATGDFATGLALVNAIGAAAEEANHHPDLDLRYGHLNIKLTSHDVGGVTDRDVALATKISELAVAAGVPAHPERVSVVEVALDTADERSVAAFWRAVLGFEPSDADEIVDGAGGLPSFWFQNTDPHETPRQRFHIDLWVPPAVAQGRIDAALAAGGTMVSDDEAPSFTVLADPEGNKVCVCTVVGRGQPED